MNSLRILVCPLNWGLGHATRCVPIIELLVTRGHQVILASDGRAGMILREQFPHLDYHSLTDLNIKYASNFFLGLGFQLPKIVRWIQNDQRKIKKLITELHIDVLISDSRPGCHSSAVPSYFIINQPNPKVPLRFFPALVKWSLRLLFKKFHKLWIPDLEGTLSLSGDLIQLNKDVPVQYLGMLSRIKPKEVVTTQTSGQILGLVSGPEPSRTLFEQALKEKLPKEKTIVVGGVPEKNNAGPNFYSYAEAELLRSLIHSADYIISRGGYSSLMDLAPFHKKLILVPTPGQTEQLYLAQRLVKRGQAVIWDMKKDSWQHIKSCADQVQSFYIKNDVNLLEKAIFELEHHAAKNH